VVVAGTFVVDAERRVVAAYRTSRFGRDRRDHRMVGAAPRRRDPRLRPCGNRGRLVDGPRPLDALPDLGDTQVIVYSRWDRSPDVVDAQ
jgi:hypothetical protein